MAKAVRLKHGPWHTIIECFLIIELQAACAESECTKGILMNGYFSREIVCDLQIFLMQDCFYIGEEEVRYSNMRCDMGHVSKQISDSGRYV